MAFDPSQVQRGIRRVAEQRIRAAQESGAFDKLAGMGEPMADLDRPFDELWWVRQWVCREALSPGQLHGELSAARQGRQSPSGGPGRADARADGAR